MARVFEMTNLTREDAEATAQRSREDEPAPLRVDVKRQSDGLYSVVVTYPDQAQQVR